MSLTSKLATHVDMRGFAYALAPFVRKQEWQMESLQLTLTRANQAVTEAQQQCDALGAMLSNQAKQVQQNLHSRPDPSIHQRGLAYLSDLQHRIARQLRKLQTLKDERALALAACVEQQRKLDGLAEHRAQAQQEYSAEVTRREAAEADRDWIGRNHSRLSSLSSLKVSLS